MFQLKLIFKLTNCVLPRELDRLLVSFLKASTQNYSQQLFESLYAQGKSIVKPYTFSCYIPGASFKGDNIILNQNEFAMFFSSADLGQMIHFSNAFKLMKYKPYPMNGNTMELSSVIMQQRQEIKDSEIVVKMQSSLIVREHNSTDNTDVYYTCNQEGFCEAAKENVKIFMEKLGLILPIDDFSIMPIKGKKVVVPVFGRNTDASLGIYKLTGTPALLNMLYMAGIGARRSEGHGKFDILL